MNLGTTTAILCLSLFGDICGAKKPPEPPASAPASDGAFRQRFVESHERDIEEFKRNMAAIELAEAKYQDNDKSLSEKTKKTARYTAYANQHADLVARTEALKVAHEANNAFFEAHQQDPRNSDSRKMSDDTMALDREAKEIEGDYRVLDLNLHNLKTNTP